MLLDKLGSDQSSDMHDLLRSFRLDVTYERGQGDYLYARFNGTLTKVLDVAGGFGVNLLGHHHRELVAELEAALRNQVPFVAQGSIRPATESLAKALRDRLGPYEVIFTNSGTETVEAALQHVFLERSKRLVWGIRGSFHGKTLGSLSLTFNHQRGVGAECGPEVCFLDPGDQSTWRALENRAGDSAAVFLEPILGEGGVIPLANDFLKWLMGFCRDSDIPIVADEIQTGLGRTGKFLACSHFGMVPDYICLGKALGGGLAKIGAMLVLERRFQKQFRWRQTSTFGGDEISSLVALRVLDLLDRERVDQRCDELGHRLKARLEQVREQFPDVIREIRGKGLMLGLELARQTENQSNVVRLVSSHDLLGLLASSYLLNVHQIRIAPSLSNPATLRVQPSVYLKDSDMEQLQSGLLQFCRAVQSSDGGHLIGHLLGRKIPLNLDRERIPRVVAGQAPKSTRRVAFIAHPLQAIHLGHWDPSLKDFSEAELDQLSTDGSRYLGPCGYDRYEIGSLTGDSVHLTWFGILPSSTQMFMAHRNGTSDLYCQQIEMATRLARDEGCQMVGLGGYTSILAARYGKIRNCGVGLTSGNALTVGMCIRAADELAAANGIAVKAAAVIGASGNIGLAYATHIAPRVTRMVLVVRNPGSRRSAKMLSIIRDAAPNTQVSLTSSLEELQFCQMIVAASNSPDPVVFPQHLGDNASIICDVALPSDIAPQVLRQCPQTMVLRGGVVRLPCNQELTLSGLALPPGRVFACVAETILSGLADLNEGNFLDDVSKTRVHQMMGLADHYGFQHEVLLRKPLGRLHAG